MQIEISTRHGHLSEPAQDKIRSRASKLSRFFDRLMAIEFVIDLKEAARPKVDLNVSAEHKHDFVASDQSDSLQGSVDAVLHKVEQQLKKYKEKAKQRHRKPDDRSTSVVADDTPETDED